MHVTTDRPTEVVVTGVDPETGEVVWDLRTKGPEGRHRLGPVARRAPGPPVPPGWQVAPLPTAS